MDAYARRMARSSCRRPSGVTPVSAAITKSSNSIILPPDDANVLPPTINILKRANEMLREWDVLFFLPLGLVTFKYVLAGNVWVCTL